MERRSDGLILVQGHTQGGSIQLSVESHQALGQMFKTVGADPENELFIFGGTGDDFMMSIDPEGFALEKRDLSHWAYEYAYKDGRINVSALINDLEIPTIGVFNAPGFHSEICLMIAPVHPDFRREGRSLSLMGSAGRHLDRLRALGVLR